MSIPLLAFGSGKGLLAGTAWLLLASGTGGIPIVPAQLSVQPEAARFKTCKRYCGSVEEAVIGLFHEEERFESLAKLMVDKEDIEEIEPEEIGMDSSES